VDPDVDHFKCYRVRRARTRVPDLTVTDQFGTLTVDVKRPSRFCVPADKNAEGINDPVSHLMCYRVRTRPRRQTPGDTIFVANQFEENPIILTGPRELCVPSLKFLPGQPTPTPTSTPDSCGFVDQGGGERGAAGICGGGCPSGQTCAYEPTAGMCGCTPDVQLCGLTPPGTGPGGMCLGLCPGSLDVCVPGKGECTCQPPPEFSCGNDRAVNARGFQICGVLTCPDQQQCVFDPAGGTCRCADGVETCQVLVPGTGPFDGTCAGLCPNQFEDCLPDVDGCTCAAE
jgi:hypothetical protein